MKNKMIKLLMLVLCGTGSSSLMAGNMGPATEKEVSSFRPFISGEGLYSWPRIHGFTMNIPAPEKNTGLSDVINQGWGGRAAVGLMHSVTERFAYSGEIGWGYYGHTQMPIRFSSPLGRSSIAQGLGKTTGNLDRWGFDALIGLLYTQPKYDLYFKAGALFQNLRVGLSNIVMNSSGGLLSLNSTTPGVLPEVKLGAAYHITDKLAANLSWMYAFGGPFDVTIPYNNVNSVGYLGALAAELKNPSMNVVMFGLEYRFA